MGIFDDAIREHLELKRHAGVDEEELKELEDEAFGPPARPGDPEFPGTSEEAAVESDAAPSPAVFDAETTEGETAEAETPDDAVIEAPSEEEPALTPIDEPVVPETDAAPAEPEAVEPVTAEERELAEEPELAKEPESPEELSDEVGDASTFTTAEREAIADQPTVFFEQQPPAEMELGDLDLDIDEEIEEVGGAVSDPLPGEEEPRIVEEAFSEPAAETEVAEPPHEPEPESEPEPEPPVEPEAPADAAPEAAEPGTSDEDVLEETPEFLRDNPDDDELWFEQGEPKDFDF